MYLNHNAAQATLEKSEEWGRAFAAANHAFYSLIKYILTLGHNLSNRPNMDSRNRSSSPAERRAASLRERSPIRKPTEVPQPPDALHYISDLTTRELLDELRARGIPAPSDKLGQQIRLRDWCDQNNTPFTPLGESLEKETPSETDFRRHQEHEQEQDPQQPQKEPILPDHGRSPAGPQNISQSSINTSKQSQKYHQRYTSSQQSRRKPPQSNESKAWDHEPDYVFGEDLNYALTDPEGATEWEGKYGISISKIPKLKRGHDGKLVQMSFSELERSAKATLWKNTPEALHAEKLRRDERKKAEEQEIQEAREAERRARDAKRQTEKRRQAQADLDARIEESLRRGSERRAPKAWFDKWRSSRSSAEKWDIYSTSWEGHVQGEHQLGIHDIPWPVISGKFENLDVAAVREFFMRAPREQLWGGKSPSLEQIQNLVKGERKRWHPDSVQRQFGGQGVDTEVMKAVNEVSSLINEVWSSISK